MAIFQQNNHPQVGFSSAVFPSCHVQKFEGGKEVLKALLEATMTPPPPKTRKLHHKKTHQFALYSRYALSFIHSLIHSLIHLLIHSLIHSFIHSYIFFHSPPFLECAVVQERWGGLWCSLKCHVHGEVVCWKSLNKARIKCH